MARVVQVFNHNTPSAPVLSGGMMLGASGVSHPSLQTIGILTGLSSADGSFSDVNGWGQVAYDSAGRMYVGDPSNGRVQCFEKNASGVWVFHSKLINVGTLLGGGTQPALVAIDRTTSPNQIHITAWDFNTATNWASVWSVLDWPNLTTVNRLRRYGANASTDTVGRSAQGLGLTIDGTFAVVSSWNTGFRQLRWNHVTGVLQNQETQAAQYAQWATDGAGNWFSTSLNGAEPGLWKNDPSNFTGISRLDSAAVNITWRRGRFIGGGVLGSVYYGGRVYARDYYFRLMAWSAVTGAFVDDFLSPGALQAGGLATGRHGFVVSNNPLTAKSGIVVDGDGCPWFVAWSANADNAATQSFLTAWPMGTSLATWTKSDWSSGVNTLQSLLVDGGDIAAEKYKVRLRKNGGAWVTLVSGQLSGAAFAAATASLGTFTQGDDLDVELSLSAWDRLDGHATLYAVRDKLSPSNIYLELGFNDTAEDRYIPYASGAYEGERGDDGAYEGEVGTSGSYEGEFGE